jgi:[acyl-carrier-protein] S-malonyltransferase
MGKALHGASEAARDVFTRADAALGYSISRLCFEGPEEELTLTENAQPAILTASIAALAALREALPDLPQPAFALGHSLGEYSALVAAGALTLEDAVRVVHLRGRAMQQAVPPGRGAMAAIMGGEPEAVRALCDEARGADVLAPANYNAPGQIVISGTAEAVARAVELASARKLKGILLKVSAPFHCSLMAPASRSVAEAMRGLAIAPLAFPVVSNVDARPNTEASRVAELLVRQIDGAVRWDDSIRLVAEQGVTRALELGPGKVLAGLVKRIDKRIAVLGCSSPEQLAEAGAFLG